MAQRGIAIEITGLHCFTLRKTLGRPCPSTHLVDVIIMRQISVPDNATLRKTQCGSRGTVLTTLTSLVLFVVTF